MSKKLETIFCYTGSFAFILFYCYIILLKFYPDVSLEYRASYIDKVRSYYPEGEFNYQLGQKEIFSNQIADNPVKKRMGSGWYDFEEEGVWTKGKRAALYYKIENGVEQNLVLNMELYKTIQDDMSVKILANGKKIGNFNGSDRTISAEIDQSVLKKNGLKLEFLIDSPARPCDLSDSEDERKLGICISSITIKER